MNLDFKLLCVLNFFIVFTLVYQSLDLILLLNDSPMKAQGITKREVDTKLVSPESAIIPKIIHQIYITEEIPLVWKVAQNSIKTMHPDYNYILWTDEKAENFITQNYPWFADTYKGYKYPVMRADALRYFLLYHYGGFYMDFDSGLRNKLDPLLSLPCVMRKTDPTGISNDIMGAIPNHPFFRDVINSLKVFDRNWLVPYITVMYSTGPLFVSVIFERYLRKPYSCTGNNLVRVIMNSNSPTQEPYLLSSEIFFDVQGSSWHNSDASTIFFLRRHWISAIVFFTALGFSLLFLAFYIEMKIIRFVLFLSRLVYRRMHLSYASKYSPKDFNANRWNIV